ncbi:MAG TPA: ATP-binding protein [Thermoanaerobaculia bacterium]|jgi:signal transduction histidine kinase
MESPSTPAGWRPRRARAVVTVSATAAGAIAIAGILAALRSAPTAGGIAALGVPSGVTILLAVLALLTTRPGVRRVAAALVAASGLLAIVTHVRSGFGDRTWFVATIRQADIELILPAPLTAVSFVCLAIAIFAMQRRVAQLVLCVPAAVSFVVLAGYLFGSPELISMGTRVPMTFWAAVSVMLLVVATVAACPRATFFAILASPNPAGKMARRLMPVVLLVPVLIGWLRLLGQRRGWYGTELGVAIYSLSVTMALVGIVLVTTRDIERADRVRRGRERELQQAEARFRMLLERSPDAVVVIDGQGKVQLVNAAAETAFGYAREEVVGRHVSLLLPAEPNGHEEPMGVRRDGTRFHADIALSPVAADDGVIVIATVRDATNRIRMEQAVRASERRFRSIFDQVPVSIWEENWSGVIAAIDELRASGVTDFRAWFEEHPEHVQELLRQVQLVNVNPETLAMFEATSAEEILSSLAIVFSTPDTLPGFVQELVALASGAEIFQTEMSLRTVKGNLLKVLLTMTFPRPGEPETPVLVTLTDITGRVRAEEALARKTADLERSNQELEQFAYVASHDLQEPLRMVASYTQLLEHRYGDKLDDDAREFIGYAVDGARRMQGLINDLLSYSRVGTRGKAVAPLDSHAALGRAIANLRLLIAETGALVTNDDLPMVMADESQFAQLFQNLIGNGIKFRRPGVAPRIHVTARPEREQWVFSVSDNGIGIDPQFHSRIFALFQRLHAREEYPGTGIGLAICKRIVERHGGNIWVESEPGRGATFFFSVPSTAGGGSS